MNLGLIFDNKEHFLHNRAVEHEKYKFIILVSLAEKLHNSIIKDLIHCNHTELCTVLSDQNVYKGRMVCRNGVVRFI